jgi:hypothetical protein
MSGLFGMQRSSACCRRVSGDGVQPINSTTVLNCIRDLQSAVLYSFTAIESLANHAIDMLDDDFTLTSRRRRTERKTWSA